MLVQTVLEIVLAIYSILILIGLLWETLQMQALLQQKYSLETVLAEMKLKVLH